MKLAEGHKRGEVKMEGNLYKKWVLRFAGSQSAELRTFDATWETDPFPSRLV